MIWFPALKYIEFDLSIRLALQERSTTKISTFCNAKIAAGGIFHRRKYYSDEC